MKKLLDKIEVIEYKYKKLKEYDTFNIFTVLRSAVDEVNLHSQFIYTLLNPNGSHKRKTVFLDKFFQVFGIVDFDLGSARIFKEYKNIDILIKNGKKAVVIENKIWAGDQDKQIERYYDTLNKEGIKDIYVIYLSLAGKDPSEISIGRLKSREDISKILIIGSYKYHVNLWIEECIKLASLYPTLRETLCQYQKLISEITGSTMNKEEYLEIIELLAENENVLQAHKIASNWSHVKWHTEWDFWIDLEKAVAQEYNILEIQKYSSDLLDRVVHYTRNRNPWYGLMFEIAKSENHTFCIFIERGLDEVYFGLTILDKSGNREASDDNAFDELTEKIQKFSDWKKENSWIGGNYLEPRINFEIFGNEATLKLINKDFRAKFINQNWVQIKGFIAKCKESM